MTWDARWVEMLDTFSTLPVPLIFLLSGLFPSSSLSKLLSILPGLSLSRLSPTLIAPTALPSLDSSTTDCVVFLASFFGSSLSSFSISASKLACSDNVAPSFYSSAARPSARVDGPARLRSYSSCSCIARLYWMARASWASSSASISLWLTTWLFCALRPWSRYLVALAMFIG